MNYPSEWLQSHAIGEKIACEVRLRIITGEIPKETILSENKLASEFSASRSPVRDALHVLANEGLIRLERMGAVVLGFNKKDLEELYDVRMLIESFILKQLCRLDQEKLVTELTKITDKMVMAMNHHNAVEFSYYDLHFHQLMIETAGHTRILRLWLNIRPIILTALLVATVNRFKDHFNEINNLIDSHYFIIKAIQSNSEAMLDKAIHHHFEDTRATVFTSLLQEDNNK
ncbi:GntR family transcriptional regulator [Heyndrickxia ginsengihumi]|uniref:GntR family transcriptional regulator n=1 Tax=Heyndrickxia ginsengihumi TaxID=363870 RepID=A0A0A6Y3I6_9BACI|nr:GntR family transcriptional regulator [Heyndrickxia ginsengihumi]KHD86792.1 hypothetical protein NG54_01680 [Heyndrickxia ginsengihumi]MBE6183317.1 GntR family transcriptional regulator [Bacillus sp. (in: firmicutes)]MCM3022268.1 GntR family transcriptional regulator [Heyndrickxia ginsengihumi]NEY18502.1 GntR family transcriptional regulator [Heyndrickxia ginsengihumi]